MDYFSGLQSILVHVCPRILSLLDKNPLSSTYGSFDRKYWQYKIIDFSCGMQQELILPLSFLWKNNFEKNIYFDVSRIAEYIKGIFLFHQKCSHPDGSMDDYFPHERAFGATAYALAAITDAAIMTNICPEEALKAFKQSGKFLADYKEAGLLSNHLAIAATALLNLYILTGNIDWKYYSEALITRLAEVQNSEGWFPEYNGCDLGYQTVTIEFLSRYYQNAPSGKLINMLKKSCQFIRHFIHPDGSLGGEYGSRNTYNFYPGGFAILSSYISEAAEILACFYHGLQNGMCNYLEDDGVFGHLLSSYVTLLSCKKVNMSNLSFSSQIYSKGFNFFRGAGLYAMHEGPYSIYGNTTKGGVYKVFKDQKLIFSDTGLVGRLIDGTVFCQNNLGSSRGDIEGNSVEIEGELQKYSCARLNRIQMIGLRILSLVFGRFSKYSNFIRRVMQKVLIYKRRNISIYFKRRICIDKNGVQVYDSIFSRNRKKIIEMFRSTDCVNMHVVTSDSYQAVNLLAWEKLDINTSKKKIEFIKSY